MSKSRQRVAYKAAHQQREVFEAKFDQMVAKVPRAGFWLRALWFFRPSVKAKAVADWTVEREKSLEIYVDRCTKKLAKIATDLTRAGVR